MARSESRWGLTRRNLVASFRSLKQARKAIDTLESHGFDAGAIRLEGAGVPRGKLDTRRRDAAVGRFVASRAAVGLVIGGGLGLGLGVIAGSLVGASAFAFALAGVAGAVVGSAIGFMVAGVASIDVTPDWERTFERDKAGPVTVAVGSDDGDKVERAQEAIEDLSPIEVHRVDEHGESV